MSEVEKAVSEIKKDYPEDVFEQMLLEYAVSYNSWEEGLKNRLLVEKVIGAELDKQVLITPGEISKYYERLPKPTLVAVQEFLDGKIYHRNPLKEEQK